MWKWRRKREMVGGTGGNSTHEEPVLKTALSGRSLPEGETDEETGDDVEHDLGHDVYGGKPVRKRGKKRRTKKGRTSRVAVVVLEDTAGDDLELLSKRRSVSETAVGGLVGLRRLTLLLLVVLVDFALNLLGVVRVVPELGPVLVDLGGSTGADDVEDV